MAEAQATFAKLGPTPRGWGLLQGSGPLPRGAPGRTARQPGEATRIYHEVLEKNPTTSLREEISNRLAMLELK
jgi:hypothetical protein